MTFEPNSVSGANAILKQGNMEMSFNQNTALAANNHNSGYSFKGNHNSLSFTDKHGGAAVAHKASFSGEDRDGENVQYKMSMMDDKNFRDNLQKEQNAMGESGRATTEELGSINEDEGAGQPDE